MASLWKSKFVVNTTTGGDQDHVKLQALKNGTFIAVWEDRSESGADPDLNAIRGQTFNADGSRKGTEFLVNSTIKNEQTTPDIAALNDGRFRGRVEGRQRHLLLQQ